MTIQITDEMRERASKAIDDVWIARCKEYLNTNLLNAMADAALEAALNHAGGRHDMTEDWCTTMAKNEGDAEIGAGSLSHAGDGWQLVPKEPTLEMRRAMERAIQDTTNNAWECIYGPDEVAVYRAALANAGDGPEPSTLAADAITSPSVSRRGEPAPTICGACGQPWTGVPCGQINNAWDHPVCYPVSQPDRAAVIEECALIAEKEDPDALICVNGHDRCDGDPRDDCPYCENRSTIAKAIRALKERT